MKFSDIPGHEEVKARLRRMADERRIPHALMLEGAPGIGKMALARAFAQYVHCTARTPDGDPCGHCPACLQHQGFNHIDTIYVFPVLKKNSKPTVSDDYAPEIHEYLKSRIFMDFGEWVAGMGNANGQPMIYVEEAAGLLARAGLKPHSSDRKIVILWLPERLRPEAANKLLKLVEEPYPDTVFVMVSDNPRGVLGTIYSRTQRIAVERYTEDEIADRLIRAEGADEARARNAAAIADGSMAAALGLLSVSQERRDQLSHFITLMRLAWQRKIMPLRAWSKEISDLGRDGSMRFYQYCSRLLRENFMLNIGAGAIPVSLSPEERDFSAKFCPFINERNVVALSQVFDAAVTDTALNGNARIIAFDLAVQVILLLKR